MEKIKPYLPIFYGLFNSLLSGLGAHYKLPISTIAGLETQSLVIALLAAAIGTICGLQSIARKRLIPLLLVIGVLSVAAILKHSYILSQGGVTTIDIWLDFFLFFSIFLAIFYIFTRLELAFAKLISTSSGNIEPPKGTLDS